MLEGRSILFYIYCSIRLEVFLDDAQYQGKERFVCWFEVYYIFIYMNHHGPGGRSSKYYIIYGSRILIRSSFGFEVFLKHRTVDTTNLIYPKKNLRGWN